jgi:hypothetical protein
VRVSDGCQLESQITEQQDHATRFPISSKVCSEFFSTPVHVIDLRLAMWVGVGGVGGVNIPEPAEASTAASFHQYLFSLKKKRLYWRRVPVRY